MTTLIAIAVVIALVAIVDAGIASADSIRYTERTDLDEMFE